MDPRADDRRRPRIAPRRFAAFRLFLIVAALLPAGCVERIVQLRTDPPGAAAWLDGKRVGVTPCDVPFTHYGTRSLALELEGHHRERRDVTLSAPWYEWFPIDLVAEGLVPFTIRDERLVETRLRPMEESAPLPEVRARAGELESRTAADEEIGD